MINQIEVFSVSGAKKEIMIDGAKLYVSNGDNIVIFDVIDLNNIYVSHSIESEHGCIAMDYNENYLFVLTSANYLKVYSLDDFSLLKNILLRTENTDLASVSHYGDIEAIKNVVYMTDSVRGLRYVTMKEDPFDVVVRENIPVHPLTDFPYGIDICGDFAVVHGKYEIAFMDMSVVGDEIIYGRISRSDNMPIRGNIRNCYIYADKLIVLSDVVGLISLLMDSEETLNVSLVLPDNEDERICATGAVYDIPYSVSGLNPTIELFVGGTAYTVTNDNGQYFSRIIMPETSIVVAVKAFDTAGNVFNGDPVTINRAPSIPGETQDNDSRPITNFGFESDSLYGYDFSGNVNVSKSLKGLSPSQGCYTAIINQAGYIAKRDLFIPDNADFICLDVTYVAEKPFADTTKIMARVSGSDGLDETLVLLDSENESTGLYISPYIVLNRPDLLEPSGRVDFALAFYNPNRIKVVFDLIIEANVDGERAIVNAMLDLNTKLLRMIRGGGVTSYKATLENNSSFNICAPYKVYVNIHSQNVELISHHNNKKLEIVSYAKTVSIPVSNYSGDSINLEIYSDTQRGIVGLDNLSWNGTDDTCAPLVNLLVNEGFSRSVGDTVELNIDTYDSSGVEYMEIFVDDESVYSGEPLSSYFYSVPSDKSGHKSIFKVKARDVSGNESFSKRVYIDVE